MGIMAAQSIGEPGTQLTLRTFHIGGTAARIVEQTEMVSKKGGKVSFSKHLKTATLTNELGEKITVATVRNGKIEVSDSKDESISSFNVPYGARIYVGNNKKIKSGEVLITLDP